MFRYLLTRTRKNWQYVHVRKTRKIPSGGVPQHQNGHQGRSHAVSFFAKVVSLMGWNSAYRYKLLGKLIKVRTTKLLFVFDLTTPEIFVRSEKEDGKIKNSPHPKLSGKNGRTSSVCLWKNTRAVFRSICLTDMRYSAFPKTAALPPRKKNPEHPEKEEQHYEQTNLFEAGPLH